MKRIVAAAAVLAALVLVAPAAAAAPAACTSTQLKLKLGPGDGAAGSTYIPLIFTNTGARSCTLRGYPGVSSVTGSTGKQVGGSATRETHTVRTITLKARGGTASALYRHVNPENFDAKDCDKATARGYRVYAPGQTRALYVANRHTACRIGRPDSVRPVVAGSHPNLAVTTSSRRSPSAPLTR
jgi:hypothetical protein